MFGLGLKLGHRMGCCAAAVSRRPRARSLAHAARRVAHAGASSQRSNTCFDSSTFLSSFLAGGCALPRACAIGTGAASGLGHEMGCVRERWSDGRQRGADATPQHTRGRHAAPHSTAPAWTGRHLFPSALLCPPLRRPPRSCPRSPPPPRPALRACSPSSRPRSTTVTRGRGRSHRCTHTHTHVLVFVTAAAASAWLPQDAAQGVGPRHPRARTHEPVLQQNTKYP